MVQQLGDAIITEAVLVDKQELRITIDSGDRAGLWGAFPFGIVVGNPNANRIFSFSTSSQVQDHDDFSQTLGCSIIATDKGYQMHLFTQEHDILIVRVPPKDLSFEAFQLVHSAISLNQRIWAYFTDVKLCGPTKQVVIVSETSEAPWVHADEKALEQFNFQSGTLDQISKNIFLQNGGQIVLPIISPDRIRGIVFDPLLDSVAACVSILNDKNYAIPILKQCGIRVPETYIVNEPCDIADALSQLDPKKKYVFKLAGSVAGVGMFTNHDHGCSCREMTDYLTYLEMVGKIPHHFQIQEFITGKSYGGIVMIDRNRNVKLLSVHQQIVHEGNFLGLLWEPETEDRLRAFVLETVEELLIQKEISLLGVFNIDFMVSEEGTKYVTEINPRYSAGVPFYAVRTLESNMQKIFPNFGIKKMFLGSNIRFSISVLQSGKLFRVAQNLHRDFNVVVLPQGINPFGNSSVLFINDLDGKGRTKFIEYVTGGTCKDLPLVTGIVEKS